MVASRQGVDPRISAAAVAATGKVDIETDNTKHNTASDDGDLSFAERAFSAACAAVLSAVVVNPLDVAKTRLQAQAAGVRVYVARHAPILIRLFRTQKVCNHARVRFRAWNRHALRIVTGTREPWMSSTRSFVGGEFVQEGFGRLWRGTNASLALALPTVGIYMPCYDVFRNSMEDFATQNFPALTPYVPLLAGSIARSLACIACYPVELARTRMQTFTEVHKGMKPLGVWKTLIEVINPVKGTNKLQNFTASYGLALEHNFLVMFHFLQSAGGTLEPIRRRIRSLMVDEHGAGGVLRANFSAGFVAGTLAAAAT